MRPEGRVDRESPEGRDGVYPDDLRRPGGVRRALSVGEGTGGGRVARQRRRSLVVEEERGDLVSGTDRAW